MSFFAELQQIVIQALAVLVPALVAAVLAWLRARTRETIAREAVAEVEQEARSRPGMRGSAKLATAVGKIKERTGAFTRLDQDHAEALVEKVLPGVRQVSKAPAPRSGDSSGEHSIEIDLPRDPR